MKAIFVLLFCMTLSNVLANDDHKTPDINILPNDCAILATEAEHRLAQTGRWTAMLRVRFKGGGCHIAVLWEAIDGRVCVYDRDGTFTLPRNTERTLEALNAAVAKVWGSEMEGLELILRK